MPQTTPLTIAQQRACSPLRDLTRHEPVGSLYVHVPFCFHKCHYCDFYSFVDSRDRQPEFTEALLTELSFLSPHAGRLRTIFVGGGTPSLLRPDLWRRLLDGLHSGYDLSRLDEFTVECNPETVTRELLEVLSAGGVNRVSVGAQSFDPRHLKTLERWHDPANVRRALECAAEAGVARRSIDLIFGAPGQSLSDWRRDLDVAVELAEAGLIDHCSSYALTYEPNTAMTKRMLRGDFTPTDDDLEVGMYEATVAAFGAHGFERYEVSNFAKPGFESRHNLAYWRQEDWLAAGPSASAHMAGYRWKNVPRFTDWMRGVAEWGGASPVVDIEPPDPRRALAERIMLGLRISEGLVEDGVLAEAERLGVAEQLAYEIGKQRAKGMIREVADGDAQAERERRVRLTDRGFLFADGVAAELMHTLQG